MKLTRLAIPLLWRRRGNPEPPLDIDHHLSKRE